MNNNQINEINRRMALADNWHVVDPRGVGEKLRVRAPSGNEYDLESAMFPNYTESPHLVIRVLGKMNPSEEASYFAMLHTICKRDNVRSVAGANCAQCCEAYLKSHNNWPEPLPESKPQTKHVFGGLRTLGSTIDRSVELIREPHKFSLRLGQDLVLDLASASASEMVVWMADKLGLKVTSK